MLDPDPALIEVQHVEASQHSGQDCRAQDNPAIDRHHFKLKRKPFAVAVEPRGSDTGPKALVALVGDMPGEEVRRIETTKAVDRLAFSGGGQTLRTDVGEFDIGLDRLMEPQDSAPVARVELNCQWIRLQGRDILWLPYEYRGSRSAGCGDTLVIGQASGAVSFFRCG